MKPIKIKINKIKSNPNNPRLIKNKKFERLVKSIEEFPEMLKLRPIVVDENNIILGGNMRYKACIEAGLKEIYCIQADELTEHQKQEFIIKDNSNFGEWDWDMLANIYNNNELIEWGLDVPKLQLDDDIEDLSSKIKDSYRVEVECENEEEQEKLYNKLTNDGYICRVLTL